jgi:hypothetical protein
MTTENDQLLNRILYAFLDAKRKESPRSFRQVVHALDSTIENWQVNFLMEQLEGDGYLRDLEIHGGGGPHELTNEGRKFIQSGGYRAAREREQRTDRIQIETLKSFKWSRAAIIISLIALLVSIFAIVLDLIPL